MNNTDIIKLMGSQRRRIQRETGQLNPNNLEDCLTQWQSKWDLQEIAPKKLLLDLLPHS